MLQRTVQHPTPVANAVQQNRTSHTNLPWFPTPPESRAELFRACGVTAAACDPCEASNQFREIPFTSSGDAPQNVIYHYPFQLGQKMYSPANAVTIRNITAFALRTLLIPKIQPSQNHLLFLTRYYHRSNFHSLLGFYASPSWAWVVCATIDRLFSTSNSDSFGVLRREPNGPTSLDNFEAALTAPRSVGEAQHRFPARTSHRREFFQIGPRSPTKGTAQRSRRPSSPLRRSR